jgi:glyoxylase-like metal-dependent hydrolase (beta-lactamase superfamily II)
VNAVDLAFDRSAPAQSGVLLPVAPGIRRIIANNPGPFTFTGTCTYVVGTGEVTVIDPGPDDATHIEALLLALRQERIARILVTHTHRDHSPGARLLAERTGAPIFGCAPHRASRTALEGEAPRLDASADSEHQPDRILAEGDRIDGDEYALVVVETPGHTANHLAFAVEGTGMVFSGDHVMAWSTSIVAPPDGAMSAYLASLEKLIAREDDRAYWPGHGGPVADPRRFTRALLSHRRQREMQVLDALGKGPARIPQLVALNYQGLDPRLVGAAGLSTFAHLEDLVSRGLVIADGPATLDALYSRA